MPSIVQLEPRTDCPDMQDGLQARIHDPLWLLARQWQFAEFKGDDAASPAAAQIVMKSSPITRYHSGPLPVDRSKAKDHARSYSPVSLPLETLVEQEPVRRSRSNDFRLAAEAGLQFVRILELHSMGIHRDIFRSAAALKSPPDNERLTLDGDTLRFLAVMARRVIDGAQLHDKLAPLRKSGRLSDLFNEAPYSGIPNGDRQSVIEAATEWLTWYDTLFTQSTENQSWIRDRLEYAFTVSGQTPVGEMVLTAPEYLEGHLDWFSFVATPGVSLGAENRISSASSNFLPVPVSFRGMPSSRLWEFEDAKVNFGKVEANPQDLARLLLVEFALVFGNDWFILPIDVQVGSLCKVASLIVTNTFGERMLIAHASEVDGPQSPWRMFCLSLDPQSINISSGNPVETAKFQDVFFLPPVLGQMLEGAAVEEVLLLRDEMANMAWALERVIQSPGGYPLDRSEALQERRRRQEAAAPDSGAEPAPTAMLAYRLGTTVPDYWIPLLPVQDGAAIRLRRGSLPRTESESIEDVFEPQGLILDPGRELLLHDEEVPREGARVTRSYQYARWSDGSTHLWIGRRKQPGRGEGSSGLRFDIVEPMKK
jgi:hypothetical protein